MESFQEFFNSINNNSILTTLIGGGVVVTLFRYIKEIGSFLTNVLLNLISFQIIERFNTEYFVPGQLEKLMYLLNYKSKILWMKKIEVLNISGDSENKFTTTPHGQSYHLLYGKLIYVDKSYEQNGLKLTTYVNIRVFFCTKKKFTKMFMNDMRNIRPKESENHITIDILECYNGIEKNKRNINSIYTDDNGHLKILDDMKKFITSEHIYKELNIPYKRNYLFYGSPGTGKTSTIQALASELDYDLLIIDCNKSRIENIIRGTVNRRKTIFLFEDIDAVAKGMGERKDQKKKCEELSLGEVSLSEILNLTDGLMTCDGSISIFTTNHIDKIDKAFIRDGRMDYKYEFKNFNSETSNRMIKDKLGITIPSINKEICPATLQESIMNVITGKVSKDDFIKEYSKSLNV